MKTSLDYSNYKFIPVDKFFEKALFDKNKGYYTNKIKFGARGDFITAPYISNLFSEIIGIWVISTWYKLGKPKKFNFVELGPGDGSLTKVLIKIFEKFPEFNKAINIILYERSELLKNLQKSKIKSPKVKWLRNLKKIKKGPIIFFGNEFFDAIPIKQFLRKDSLFFEKCYILNNKKRWNEIYKKASKKNISQIKSYEVLKNLKFIEYPKLGFDELGKIVKKISKLSGGILLIDYGYLGSYNSNTLQSVKKNRKTNLLNNIGTSDVTSLVNFNLLKEFFLKNNFKVKKIVSQKFFLEKMGIIERANILKKKMSTKEQINLDSRLFRLLNKQMMGDLFKVIFAFKSKKSNFLGFK